MKNSKPPSWPFILSGITLVLYALFSFITTFWLRVYNLFQDYDISRALTISIDDIFDLIVIFGILLLALSFFLKKKNAISIIAGSIILLSETFLAVQWFLYTFHFYWNRLMIFAILYSLEYVLLVAGGVSLIVALLLGIFRPKNVFVKIFCFVPATVQFLYLICVITSTIVTCVNGSVYMLSLIDILLFILRHAVYFIALIFVGIACKTPLTKKR